jgi:hypothetical protein
VGFNGPSVSGAAGAARSTSFAMVLKEPPMRHSGMAR